MPRLSLSFVAILAFSVLVSGIAGELEQEPAVATVPRRSPPASRPATLRADVKVVLVPVSVTDALDRPVTALPKASFHVLEDGVEQTITSFAREEAPVSLGLLFDSSGSMKSRMEGSITALKHLFRTTLPGDEFFVVQFADQARILGGFTSDPEDIYRRLGFVEPKGWTALLDAVAMGTHEMKAAKNRRRVLLVLSDGNDNNSRFTESEIKAMVMEGDVRVYAIGLYYRPRLLRQLADETGGKVLVAQNMAELPDVVQRLSAEIRNQYLIGYTSSNAPNDGKYHKVKVEVVQAPGAPALHASWRHGYYAPGE
jgi:Ca-activated chloride channel family protein